MGLRHVVIDESGTLLTAVDAVVQEPRDKTINLLPQLYMADWIYHVIMIIVFGGRCLYSEACETQYFTDVPSPPQQCKFRRESNKGGTSITGCFSSNTLWIQPILAELSSSIFVVRSLSVLDLFRGCKNKADTFCTWKCVGFR